MYHRVVLLLLPAACAWLAGCNSPEAEFRLDRVYIQKSLGQPEDREEAAALEGQLRNLKDVMVGLFGTPDDPHVPQLADANVNEVLSEELIRMAAGPVGRHEDGTPRGLYREHCAHCHGVNGDGAGPTAPF